jgi:diguanylate cyclase
MADNILQFGLGTLLTASTAELILGTALGWFLRSRAVESRLGDEEISELRDHHQTQKDHLDQVLRRVAGLTDNIGRDVGEHASRVQQIGADMATASNQPNADLQAVLTDAMLKVTTANERLHQKLADAEQKLAEQSDELKAQAAIARTDKLTGLLNRRAFDDALAQRVGEFQRYGAGFALLMVDIDHFKRVNDAHGHQAGDELLRLVAASLTHAMRDVDIVCRYGGEEFAIIMPATDLGGAGIAAERARHELETAIVEFAGHQLRVTISGGAAAAMPGESAESIVGRADSALYAAKSAGRNRVYLHDGIACHAIELPATAAAVPQPQAEPIEPEDDSDPSAAASATAEPPMAAPNFPRFIQQLRQALDEHKHSGHEVSVIVGQVDRPGAVGSPKPEFIVDIALRSAMQFMRAAHGQADAVTRIGEDRFAVVSTSGRALRSFKMSERVRMAIEKCRVHLPGCPEFGFTVSFGVTEAATDDNADLCFTRCLGGLESAIAAGGNQTQRVETEPASSGAVLLSADAALTEASPAPLG